jgi:hypothetical protein
MHQFSGVTELIHDSLGHADCLGSGYVMRRTALEEIGGFPIESLSEDVCCSAKMLGAGWKTCFIPESLQHGSVPESYNAHVKQRTRWVCVTDANEMRRKTNLYRSSLWATSRLRSCSSFAFSALSAST